PWPSADLQRLDLVASHPEAVIELDRATGEVAHNIRDNRYTTTVLLGAQRLDAVFELLPCLAQPQTDGLMPPVLALLVEHSGVLGKAVGETGKVSAIAHLEIGGDRIGQCQAHGCDLLDNCRTRS